jgi:hypothetical protein
MRLTLALILLAIGVGFVVHERRAALERHLGDVASELGHRHVHAHCQGFAASLWVPEIQIRVMKRSRTADSAPIRRSPRGVRKPVGHAARAYSWMSPPRRSCR